MHVDNAIILLNLADKRAAFRLVYGILEKCDECRLVPRQCQLPCDESVVEQ